MNRVILSAFAVAALVASSGQSFAVVTVLSDRNSNVVVDDTSQAGMFNWNVDGVSQLYQQWFWYRVGNAQQQSIDTLPVTGRFATDTNPFDDPANDTLAVRYQGPGFTIQPSWRLVGGANNSGTSDVSEQIAIHNLGTSVLDFTFYQYSDFDLNGTPNDDSVAILNAQHNTAYQVKNGFSMTETVVTPAPTHWEVNYFANTLNRLNTIPGLDLNDDAGAIGPGDLTWAFQWHLFIDPGATVIISKDKAITPTPGSIGLLGLGGLVAFRRRR